MIGFGQIRHVRLRPAHNAFAYPGYFVRLPLRALAARPEDAGWLGLNRRGLLTVNDRDHG